MMKVKKSKLIIVFASILVLLTYSFPFSTYLRIAFVCGSAGYFVLNHLSKKVTAKAIYILCFVLFCVWATLSYLWASSLEGVTEQIFNMYVAIMANIMMVAYITTYKEKLDDTYKWLLPIALIYLVQSIFVGHFDSEMRFSATGAVNQFGISTSYIYLFALYAAKEKKGKRWIAYLILGLSLILSLLTGSRKTLVNLVLFTCMVMLFSKYDKNVFKNLGRVLLVLAVAVIAVIIVLKIEFLYNILGNRLVSLLSYFNGDVTEDLSALRREYMKADAVSLFLSNPLKGIGLNNFKYIARYGTYAHSNYYELLCCLGVVGAMLYYIPLAIVSVKSFFQWKKNMSYAVIPLAIFLSFIINEFSNVSYIYRMIHIFLGIGAGMVFVNENKNINNMNFTRRKLK